MTLMKRILTIAAACMLLASCATNAGKNDATVAEESAPSVAEESVASGAKPQLYDESVDLLAQIDAALKEAGKTGKFVICQVGGNWCRWCIMFADFISSDEDIAKLVADNFVYIHVNYDKKQEHFTEMSAMLGDPGRFGFPCLVVLSPEGKVLHIQDSSFLEEGEGYDRLKVLRFFSKWTPEAVNPAK